MRVIKFFSLIVLTFLFANPACAIEKKRTGMSYTAKGGSTLRSMSYAEEEAETGEPTEEEETPSSKVWKKYKALAAGTSEEDPEEDGESEDTQEEGQKPGPPEAQKKSPKPTGLAAIIAQYQKNKEERSGMKSLTVSKPEEAKEPEKPEEEK